MDFDGIYDIIKRSSTTGVFSGGGIHDIEEFISVYKSDGVNIYHDGDNKIKIEYAVGYEDGVEESGRYTAYAVITETDYRIKSEVATISDIEYIATTGQGIIEIMTTSDKVRLPKDISTYSYMYVETPVDSAREN